MADTSNVARALRCSAYLCIMVWIFPAQNAHAELPLLTESESLRIGLSRPELVEVAKGRLEISKQTAAKVGRWDNPEFGYDQESVGNEREQSYSISQQLDLFGHRRLKRQSSELLVEATRLANLSARADQGLVIRKAFYTTLLHKRQVEYVQNWGQVLNLASPSHKDGQRLQRERMIASARLRSVRADYVLSWHRLRSLLGVQSSRFGSVKGKLHDGGAISSLDAYLSKVKERPDLKELEEKIAAKEHLTRAAKRQRYPGLTVGVGTKTRSSGGSSLSGNTVQLGLSIPIVNRGQSAQNIAATEATNLRHTYQLLLDTAQGEVRALYHRLAELDQAVASYRQQARSYPSGLHIRDALNRYQSGESNLIELLDVFRSALEAQLQLLDLSYSARMARIELDWNSGVL